jgi:hypothetical protein
MNKVYLAIISALFCQFSFAQCPVIDGAMVNSCAADGITEGINEFVYFTTPAAGAVSLYKFSYGSRNPPASQTPTGYLSGLDATAKIGPGSLLVQPGCTLTEVTSSSTSIPADSRVVFIPYNFDQVYDLSAVCKNGNVYVVYININNATTIASRWLPGGTLANAASALRYLQMEYNGNPCLSNVRSYDGALWANPGNTPEADGNSLAWDAQGNTLYVNNGCSIIVTPVQLLSFNAFQNGKDVTVSWKTASELNTREFQVQWSSDGRNFSSIGTVNASGNSDVLLQYAFVDKNIASGNHFYRLKIIDVNGSFTLSPVVKLNLSGGTRFSLYPTISTGNLTMEYNAVSTEPATAQVYDHLGRLLFTKKIQLQTGYNKIQLTVNNLPAGEYLFKLVNNSDNIVTRFFKL